MSVPCCAIFLSRRNIQGHSPKSEGIDWRQHLTDACQPAVLGSTSICICTPDSENWIHNKCCTELHKPWMNSLPSPPLLLSFALGLSRVAELHTRVQQGHKENIERLQRQKSPFASLQVCISHQWVLRTSLPQGHTATVWKPLFLSQAAGQGCREKACSLTHAQRLHS